MAASSSIALTAAVALTAPLVVTATKKQKDYPACAVNHKPEYFCCDVGGKNVIYIQYRRPEGDGYTQYYIDGWKEPRRIDWPTKDFGFRYKADTADFRYDEPDKICRVNAKMMPDSKDPSKEVLAQELQCTFDAPLATLNKTWTENSQVDNIFLTSLDNPRNNNASIPVGVQCTSLGTVPGDEAKAACPNPGFAPTSRISTFKETPLVILYVLYILSFVFLGMWVLARGNAKPFRPVGASSEEDGHKKLLDERGGPNTPDVKHGDTQMRKSEVNLRNSTLDIVQTGYSNSSFASAVFGYFVLATIGLNPMIIVLILDGNFKFKPVIFVDADKIVVYILLWAVTCVWLGVFVVCRDKLMNFFRKPVDLESCEYVRMFKPEVTEVLLADRSGVSEMVARVEKMFFPKAQMGYETTVKVETASNGARFVEFQHLRFTYDSNEKCFIPGHVVLPDRFDGILAESSGLSTEEHINRLDVVGRNAIEVEMPSMGRSVVEEFFKFFYIYQLMCYYVWFFTGYTYVAWLNTVVIIVSASINILTKRHMMASVVSMTHYTTTVSVNRDGQWREVESPDLVPGDLVRVNENWELPCDLAIVKGSTVCDESMLTGESMPVQKFPIPEDSTALYEPDRAGKKHTLFSGTKTLASGRNEDIHAIVQSTGAHTSRGQLVQAILYPVPVRFKYDEHMKVVVTFLFLVGCVSAYMAMKFLAGGAGLDNKLFGFVYGMFMFSAVLSPLLPVVITVGQVNAAKRLKSQGVFCLNPQRITLCGKVRAFCFDKTGTITKQGLDFRGSVPVADGVFGTEVTDSSSGALNTTMKYGLASCHALGSLNGELVGNEVEVKMFKSTGWKLIELEGQKPTVESGDGRERLEVVKRFEFDHHRMSMSVLMRDMVSGKLYVFCKGSYEKMQSLSLASSIPSNYKEIAEGLAKDGCYVLGMGFKEVSFDSDEQLHEFLSNRDAVEANVNLLGLIMFRNELKEDSRDAILTLKKGDIRCVMITGDNAMTGCYIARASGMVEKSARVILGDMVSSPSGSSLVWSDVDSYETYTLEQIYSMTANANNIELAVTGKAFDYLTAVEEIKKLLLRIRIFSRMTPNGKVECVKLHMDAGAVTGMCGDGGNDCGALRIAHVGVALSEAEASVVSPFTSKTKSLQSIVDLVLEGRGALATSFGNVKFLILYGLVGIGLRCTMYYNSVFVGEWGFIYCDGVILVGLSYAITRSRPLKTMGNQRPTSSLIGTTTVCSIFGQAIIHWIFLYIGMGYLMDQPWYCPFAPDNVDMVKWWLLQDTHLSSCLWFFVCYQQMCSAITCSLGSKFRRMLFRNYFLMFYYALVFGVLTYTFVGEPTRFSDWFRVASSTNVIGLPDIPLPAAFRVELFGIAMANTLTVILFEFFVILGPVRNLLRNKFHKEVLPLKL